MSLFDSVMEKVSRAATSVSGKTRDSVEITKLVAEGRSIEADLRDLYGRLGRAYYESQGQDGEAIADLCGKIDDKQALLKDIENRKLQIRNQIRCPGCGTVVAEDAKFCSACGLRLPEAPKDIEETPESADAVYCPKCGAMRKGEDRFCEICGHDYESTAQPEVKAEDAPAAPQEDSEAPTDFNAD